ncbi:hypothetical protein [Streptomyces sp. NPDC048419]|uniref:hypothetical protein n=1 Tax=Streptomyces sp. NPDC048419 TaxID=3365547 RepID=UPI0037105C06
MGGATVNSGGKILDDGRRTTDDGLPPLLRELVRQGWFGDLLHWRAGDRVIAASVGHEDKEEPVVLFAAVAASLP